MELMFDVEEEPRVELLEEKTVFPVKVKRVKVKNCIPVGGVWHCCWKALFKKFEFFFFFLLLSNMFLMFSNHFDVLISKIIFKK
jgi:hypothetical protein